MLEFWHLVVTGSVSGGSPDYRAAAMLAPYNPDGTPDRSPVSGRLPVNPV